jgi:hypothetical protein
VTVKLKVYPNERPKTRGECADMPRPCPFVSCKWHLAHSAAEAEVDAELVADAIANETGDTCALDVADRGPSTQREVARCLNLSHQRVSQIEEGLPFEVGSHMKRDVMATLAALDSASHDPTLFALEGGGAGPEKSWSVD